MRNRGFGVEIEFGTGQRGKTWAESLLGRELGIIFDSGSYISGRWSLGWDGTELELRTPVLRGKKGFNTLKDVMNCLNDNNCFVTESDGLHVHHDAPEFVNDIDKCIQLVASWYNNRNIIYQFVDPLRTEDEYGEDRGYWACPKWHISEIRRFRRERELADYDRHDLNLISLLEHGSIEIRLHEGTLNYEEAESWIRFGQRFIDSVVKRKTSVKYTGTPETLLKRIKVSPNAQIPLLKKGGRTHSAKVIEDALKLQEEAKRALKSL